MSLSLHRSTISSNPFFPLVRLHLRQSPHFPNPTGLAGPLARTTEVSGGRGIGGQGHNLEHAESESALETFGTQTHGPSQRVQNTKQMHVASERLIGSAGTGE